MKILVTGGTGMLGRAFVSKYSHLYNISFTGRNYGVGENIAQKTGARFLQIDLSEQDELTEACKDVDVVVHCAALSSLWGPQEAFRQINVEGTRNILDAAVKNGVNTFIHISTPSLYFEFRDRLQIGENAPLPLSFCNQYAASKAQAEKLVLTSQLKSVILRPRGIFGPYDTSIVPRVLKSVRNGKLLLPSGRNPLIDITYVENVADAIHLAATTALDSKEVFNITNGEPSTVFDILQQLFEAASLQIRLASLPYGIISPIIRLHEAIRCLQPDSVEPKLTRYSAAMFHYHQTLDISKARNKLGYSPEISLAEGIQRYGRWYKDQNL